MRTPDHIVHYFLEPFSPSTLHFWIFVLFLIWLHSPPTPYLSLLVIAFFNQGYLEMNWLSHGHTMLKKRCAKGNSKCVLFELKHYRTLQVLHQQYQELYGNPATIFHHFFFGVGIIFTVYCLIKGGFPWVLMSLCILTLSDCIIIEVTEANLVEKGYNLSKRILREFTLVYGKDKVKLRDVKSLQILHLSTSGSFFYSGKAFLLSFLKACFNYLIDVLLLT